MIRNEQQYRTTRQQVGNFERTIAELKNNKTANVHAILKQAELDALQFQCNELLKDLHEYEALRSGKLKVLEVDSFDELPIGLIRARIAKGLSQKELAEKLGLKEQQIQRYEASNYSTASFDRIKDVVAALGIKIQKEIFISRALFTKSTLLKNLKSIGIDSSVIMNRFLHHDLAQRIEHLDEYDDTEAKTFLHQAAAEIGRILGVSPNSLSESKATLELNLSAVRSARFKKSVTTSKEKVSAYTIYAHTIALLLLESTKTMATKKVPDASALRRAAIKKYSRLTLETLLNTVWDLGIPVFPLKDPGSFHGACWRVDGRNVIVIKQKTMSESRWLYDLAHETCHASQHPDEPTLNIIESEAEARDWLESEDEKEANYYAGEVVLGEDVDELAEQAILSSKKDLVKLKSAVTRVAADKKVDPGALANYIAFRLQSEQNINWWATAQNLQTVMSDPFEITKKVLLERVDLETINEFDRQLLIRALI